MSRELKNRTKKFALDVIGLCAGLPHLPETRHGIDQLIRSSSSVAANYRSACRWKSKADFIAKLGLSRRKPMSPASGSRCCATSASFQAQIANRELIIHSVAHGRKFGIQNSTFELHKN
jgi:hypothetical protein